MGDFEINKCKSTHGRFNLDNGNVIIELDVELDTTKIKKNIALKLENLVESAPELLEAAEELTNYIENYMTSDNNVTKLTQYKKMKETMRKLKGDDENIK